ncbi:hypothetical protein ACT6QH_11930 [Xanthobacter sp. TB0139]|uniref:hypothetical protein n=1 Tax=Xanthobacter sp. TB0139 TaxID=3459178 RepID=UPI0040391632
MNRTRHESAAARGPRPQVLFFLCAAGVVLFNFPLLMVWDSPSTVLGLPLLPVALFTVWAGLIVVLAIVCERMPRRNGEPRMEAHLAGGAVAEAGWSDAETGEAESRPDAASLQLSHREPGDGRTA